MHFSVQKGNQSTFWLTNHTDVVKSIRRNFQFRLLFKGWLTLTFEIPPQHNINRYVIFILEYQRKPIREY